MAEQALGNEHFARELLDADASVVEKLLHRIEDVKETLARRKDAAAKEAFEEVRKAEQMFLDALAEKGMRFEGGKIVGASEEDDENTARDDIDKKQTIRYNKKRYAPQDISTITRVSYNHHAWATNYITGCLMPEEIGEFSARISEFTNGIYYPCRTKDGMFLFEVGKYVEGEQTTLILTDGDYERPSIEAVYKLHTDKAEATTDVKEFIETNAKYDEIGRLAESFEAYAGSDEKTGFSEFTPYNHPTYEEFDRERKNSQKAGRNSGARKDGRGDFAGTRTSVKKSRKTTAKPPETSHLTAMQKQTVANYSRAKVYTKAEALKVVEDMARMLDENYGFDGGMGEVSGFVTLTKTVEDAQSLFSFLVKIHPNKKTNRNKKCVVKNKFPISENNIRKPIDKPLEKVYNDANETKSLPKEEAPLRRIELWQPNPRNPLPLWSPLTPIARRSARLSRRP
ncbi:MAG: hypothetical protein IKU90_06990 [Clostridia bacterium]|nr:hypothetical protein [Clostridia bacterium]